MAILAGLLECVSADDWSGESPRCPISRSVVVTRTGRGLRGKRPRPRRRQSRRVGRIAWANPDVTETERRNYSTGVRIAPQYGASLRHCLNAATTVRLIRP